TATRSEAPVRRGGGTPERSDRESASRRRRPARPETIAPCPAEGISSDSLHRTRTCLRLRPQQLHQLAGRRLRLLAQFGREARRQLEIELGVPVVGGRFDGAAEFFFGAAQPAEPRITLLLGARLVEKRARGPEVRLRAFGRPLGFVDGLAVPLEPI